MSVPKTGDLRVWHIPQVPGAAFHVPVTTPREGALLLRALADYDLFQLQHRIKPDYANAQGLEVFDGEEWYEWCSDDGEEIDDVAETLLTAPPPPLPQPPATARTGSSPARRRAP